MKMLLSTLLFVLLGLCPLATAQPPQVNRKPVEPRIVWVTPASDEYDPLPTGVTHHTMQSKAAGQPVGYTIYLPPDYDKNKDQRYPVIYNLHGQNGNERIRLESMAVLHEGILKGWWPAMIMVRPNGGRSTYYKDSADGRFPIETMFIKELIPHVDATYRTIAARHGRCIEGFSMGGRGSTRLAVKYPDLFCSLFCQAGNVPRISELYDPSHPELYPMSYLGPEKQNHLDNDPFVLLKKNLARIKGRLRIMLFCGTHDRSHLVTTRDFHAELLKQGVDHTYMEVESLKHNRKQMIAMLKPILFRYHVESMRLAREQDGGK